MPTLTNDQLAALARTGALNREIEAALDRPMDAAERAVVDRARVVWRLQRSKRAAERVTPQEAKALWREKDRSVPRRSCTDQANRKKLERNPAAWLRFFFPRVFTLAWSTTHRAMIRAAIRTMRDGTGMAVAAPRGEGKTRILSHLALFGVLSGLTKLPMVVGWKHSAAKGIFRGWLNTVADNTLLADYYPEFCDPFRESKNSKRLKTLVWEDDKTPCGADVHNTESYLVLPSGRGALAAASVQGSIRGVAIESGGEWIRPDVLLLDDPQDKPTAASTEMVRKIMERIDEDLMSLAGPDRRIALMAAVTVIEPDDVAEQLLARRDVDAIRCGQIVQWPANFAERDSATRKLWEAWNEERLEGMADHDGGKRALAHYKKNRKALLAGMRVSWPQRYDAKRGDPDAYYSAMWDYYRIGEAAFMAERQNQPMKEGNTVYDLKPELISSMTVQGRVRGDLPPRAQTVVAGTDINHYGLHSSVLGFENDQTSAVAWYDRYDKHGKGIVPKNCPEQVAKTLVFEALVAVGEQMKNLPIIRDGKRQQIGAWLIDAGYMPDVVRRYVEGPGRTLGMPVIAARGYSYDKYRPTGRSVIGKPREGCHYAEGPVVGRFLAFNADYWREIMQRAWLGSPGAPGGVTLWDGRHTEFAEHICREKLLEKLQGAYGPVWRWATQPGWHDYGDAVVMAYVGAAWGGIGTTGTQPIQFRRGPRRQCKTAIEE